MTRPIADDDPRWPRLEKVWLEEGMQVKVKQLAERFGMSVPTITRHLINKFGTVSAAVYRGEKPTRYWGVL